jgi:hypothetical protein
LDTFLEGMYARRNIGAADALINEEAFTVAPCVVIEGGPGQGKSTLTQYVCQVHRIRLLGETRFAEQLPARHKPKSVRLPLRVELKDFAAWMSGENPFVADDQQGASKGPRTMEGFLAEQISSLSGGARFDVADLHAVARVSSILLVLDGLDEVAEINDRRKVVDECRAGIGRLKELSASTRVVITSRPAAFVNSPGFPKDEFAYFDLGALTEGLVEEYAEKWLNAKRLDSRTAASIRRTLKHKLEQPHLRELARNPMQLAILLGLLHNRGVSLPDKRTALYTSYVELFLNREAEKSDIVRDNRELLEGLHGYLGFFLHSESERGKNRAGIRGDRLEKLIADYLVGEGRPPSLLKDLQAGIVERVVFLVSRVQGLYEFEVQPLREYFAASHLYRTAPYSPQGRERRGTILDRFDALAKNFYWLNVLRFFAGFFDKGELPALVDRLEELFVSEGFKNTAYPAQLAAMLLTDRVFSQHSKAARAVARLVVKGIEERRFPVLGRRYSSQEISLEFAIDCGRDEVSNALRDLVLAAERRDQRRDLLLILRLNSSLEDRISFWRDSKTKSAWTFEEWLEVGLHASALPNIPVEQLHPILKQHALSDGAVQTLLQARQSALIEQKHLWTQSAIQAIGRGNISFWQPAKTLVEALASYLNPGRYEYAIYGGGSGGEPFLEHIVRHGNFPPFEEDVARTYDARMGLEQAKSFILTARELVSRSRAEWSSSFVPWNSLLAAAQATVGDDWAVFRLAWGALWLSRKVKGAALSLQDTTVPICERLASAVARRTAPNYWKEQLQDSLDEHQISRTVALLLAFASPKVLMELTDQVREKVSVLSQDAWKRVSDVVRAKWDKPGLTRDKAPLLLDAYRASPRILGVLSLRVGPYLNEQFFAALSRVKEPESEVLRYLAQASARIEPRDDAEWRTVLGVVRKAYAAGVFDADDVMIHRENQRHMPTEILRSIAARPRDYPPSIPVLIDERIRGELGAEATPIKVVADQQQWWEELAI